MDIVQQLGAALGLGFLSGMRLYLTVLAVGAAVRFHWLQITDTSFSGLSILADWRVMAFAGSACLIEFVADKVPWVDSAWDSIHTFIRPIGAALLGASAFSTADPALRVMLMILCGGVALTGHSAKAATRLAVNHSPEPFSNLALSLAGDVFVPVATWFTFRYPAFTIGFVLFFAAVTWWLSPRIFRAIRVEFAAIGSAFARWMGAAQPAGLVSLPAIFPREFADHLQPLPPAILDALHRRNIPGTAGIRCAATTGADGLKNSIGYLVPTADNERLIFIARRWFRYRIVEIPYTHLARLVWRNRWISDTLVVERQEGRKRSDFEVFRAPVAEPAATRQEAAA
jgi:hypothetical protein